MRCISEGTDHEHRIRDRALLQPELPYPFQLDDYTPPQPEWTPEPKPATPDITDHDGPRSVSEADWLEFNTEANDYGVPDRAGLQSVIDVIGEHYLHLAREWGWNDTEVRDAMYVETKQRGWCRE